MADNPEARAQLARLAGDDRLRDTGSDDLEPLIERDFEAILDGLAAEAAASDDVSDEETALLYLEGRLSFLEGLISSRVEARLREALRAKIASW